MLKSNRNGDMKFLFCASSDMGYRFLCWSIVFIIHYLGFGCNAKKIFCLCCLDLKIPNMAQLWRRLSKGVYSMLCVDCSIVGFADAKYYIAVQIWRQ